MQTSDLNKLIHKITYAKPIKRIELFNSLNASEQSILFLHLTRHLKTSIIQSLSNDEIISILENLDPDDATDVVQLLDKKKASDIVNKLSSNLRESVNVLAKFDPKTAAGLMNLDYILVDIKTKLFNVAEKVRIHEKRTGRLPLIIVTKESRVVGYLPEYELALGNRSELVEHHVRKIGVVKGSANYNDVASVLENHPHGKIVVLSDDENVLGVLYSDDIIKLLRELKGQELYDFAGVSKEESVYYSVIEKVKSRYKWLIVNLGTAFLASFVVGHFDQTISKYVLLAVYMPIIAGMGGNAGTQTLAIIIRGITLGQVSLSNIFQILKKELGAAFINGFINAVIVATIVFLFNHDIKLAIVLGLAMISNLLVSGFFGTLIPVLMKKLGRDPATSATVFITTATDVLGFFVFLELATLLL